MKVSVIGLGYVGLPLAIRLAQNGHRVIGVDVNEKKISSLRRGILPFANEEPNFEKFFLKTRNYVEYTADFSHLKSARVLFVCVDTPTIGRKPNYRSLHSAINSIAMNFVPGQIIVLESTMAPKTTEKIIIPQIESMGYKLNRDFFIAVAPERIRPNYIFRQMTTLPRIIGVSSPVIVPILKNIYSKITSGDVDFTNVLTAEVAKTVENSYRDVQIAFANEIAIACEELGVNVWEVRKLVNKDPFKDIHYPGAGVGGHCIPKDSWLLASSVKEARLNLIKNARSINDAMPRHVFELIREGLKKKKVALSKAKVIILGYSFVRDSDDTRNSPTQSLIEILKKYRISFRVHDPFVKDYSGNKVEQLIEGSDCIVLMVNHSPYENLHMDEIAQILRTKIIIDGRNFFDKKKSENLGFLYKGIGNV